MGPLMHDVLISLNLSNVLICKMSLSVMNLPNVSRTLDF